MRCDWEISRRKVLQLLAGSLCAPNLPIAARNRVAEILRGASPRLTQSCWYRIDATVSLWGMTFFVKWNAGGAYASVEICESPARRDIGIQFAAGSWPDRVHGLNRFGIWREAVVEQENKPLEISFAGLLTDSREQTLTEGRSTLAQPQTTQTAIVARGGLSNGHMCTWLGRVALEYRGTWTGLPQLLTKLTGDEPSGVQRQIPAQDCTTFLHAMMETARQDVDTRRCQFAHAGKLYTLETRRHPKHPLEFSGGIRGENGKLCSEFRVAYADSQESRLPARIEYRPKPFLNLTFEIEPTSSPSAMPSVFEENA